MPSMHYKEVNESFLAATPLIASEIKDMSVQVPNWLIDVYKKEPWPTGEGTQMQEITMRGELPETERGLRNWKKMGNAQGCDPGSLPGCGYNWTTFGGYGLERKVVEMMQREFKTSEYCIAEIQTTAHFKQVFSKVIQNIYRQTEYFKEMNIGLNFLTMLAKKFVVDAEGAKANPHNLYVYRAVGANRLSTLNINMLEFFYEHMRRIPDAIPYDVVDGSPLYAIAASHQLLARLYRDDANLRTDVHFSGAANDNLMKYNFMSTIRGMFLPTPMLYPRRFVVVSNELVEVLPFINGVPAEVGSFSDLNPGYEAATHEEILIHGKDPFKIYYMDSEQSLGEGSSFGPEPSFLESWQWINPQTTEDPFRRVGYYASSIKIGLSPQHSEGLFGIVVERPSVALMAMYTPNPVAPVAAPENTNVVASVTCPCPVVLSIQAHPITADRYFFTFATPITGAINDVIVFELNTGATVSGTLENTMTADYVAEMEFVGGLGDVAAESIIGISCLDTSGCSAHVMSASDCRAGETDAVSLVLNKAIRAATAADIIVAYFGDCTEAELEVVSVDGENLTWVVKYGTGYGPTDDPTGAGDTVLSAGMICDRGGIIKVCVPTATDASCPSCDAPTATACSGAQD